MKHDTKGTRPLCVAREEVIVYEGKGREHEIRFLFRPVKNLPHRPVISRFIFVMDITACKSFRNNVHFSFLVASCERISQMRSEEGITKLHKTLLHYS